MNPVVFQLHHKQNMILVCFENIYRRNILEFYEVALTRFVLLRLESDCKRKNFNEFLLNLMTSYRILIEFAMYDIDMLLCL